MTKQLGAVFEADTRVAHQRAERAAQIVERQPVGQLPLKLFSRAPARPLEQRSSRPRPVRAQVAIATTPIDEERTPGLRIPQAPLEEIVHRIIERQVALTAFSLRACDVHRACAQVDVLGQDRIELAPAHTKIHVSQHVVAPIDAVLIGIRACLREQLFDPFGLFEPARPGRVERARSPEAIDRELLRLARISPDVFHQSERMAQHSVLFLDRVSVGFLGEPHVRVLVERAQLAFRVAVEAEVGTEQSHQMRAAVFVKRDRVCRTLDALVIRCKFCERFG